MTIREVTLPETVVIVGGGSAGWMTAAYLSRTLPAATEIMLIESAQVATIGVGEGTIPAVRNFIRSLGIDETDLIRECNATFKLGVRFEGWNGENTAWWHPFFADHTSFSEESIVRSWLAHRSVGDDRLSDLTLEDLSLSWQMASERRCPMFRPSHGSTASWHPDYAFHFDAALFGQLLKSRVALPGGVTAITDHVIDVEVVGDRITSVITETNGRIDGDFFVDCTGFRRLLIERVGDAEFNPCRDELPCDRAVTMSVPYLDRAAEMLPYTLSTALSAGWVWRIGLSDRLGVGYVYSSAHISDDDAEAELRSFVDSHRPVDQRNTDGLPTHARRLRFDAGHLARPFAGNCVALGLSEGFLEPLEATSLGVTALHITKVAEILCDNARYANGSAVDEYNEAVQERYSEIKEFLVSHYCLSDRCDTPFWRDVRTQNSRLTNGGPAASHVELSKPVFSQQSWQVLASAFNVLPPAVQDSVEAELTVADLRTAHASLSAVATGFARQHEYLDSVARSNSGEPRDAACPIDDADSFIRTESPAAIGLDLKLNAMDLTAAEKILLSAVLAR